MTVALTQASSEALASLRRQRLVAPASELDVPPKRFATGIPALDQPCGGGLPLGRICELVVGSSGGAAVLQAVLGRLNETETGAVVDPANAFDVASAQAAGVDLSRILWVRPNTHDDAFRAAELVLQSQVFAVVGLYLPYSRENRVKAAAWVRLDRAARASQTLVLSLSHTATVGPFAALVVEVTRCQPRWRGLTSSQSAGSWLSGLEHTFVVHRHRLRGTRDEEPAR